MSADLHTHSTASDGQSTPAQLVAEAREAGLSSVALTDHDSYDGLDEAWAAAGSDLRVLCGMEMSTLWNDTSVHLLAYGDLRGDDALATLIAGTVASRVDRARDMGVRLAAGEPGLVEDDLLAALVASTPPGATPGRPHLADALVRLGVVSSRDEAFVRLLAENGPYYVPYRAPSTRTAIGAVRAAGGVPVLAHPRGRRGAVLSDSQIADLAEAGLQGLEVDHRDHDDVARYGLRVLAKDLDLLVTGASDYHGSGKLNRLGENTTDPSVVEEIDTLVAGRW